MAGWIQGAGAPVAQRIASVCELDGRIYATGGFVNDRFSAATQAYDAATGSWLRRADMPLEMHGHAFAGAAGALYAFGGSNDTGVSWLVHRYEVGQNRWTQVLSAQAVAVEYMGAATVNGMIYLLGGRSQSSGMRVRVFDPARGSVEIMGDLLPTVWFSFGCAVLDGLIYLVGGREINDYYESRTGRCAVFDPVSGEVRALAGMPLSGDAFVNEYGGELYALAGQNLLIYNPEQDAWRYGEGVPSSMGAAMSLDQVDRHLIAVPNPASDPVLSLDLRAVEIVGAQPAAGFVNERVDNRFSWQIAGNSATTQREATLQWRQAELSMPFDLPVSGPETGVTIPANTFSNTVIDWRVSAVTVEGVETGWSEWYRITCVDEPHEAPSNLYPGSGRRNASVEMQLSWVVNSPLGSSQTGYEVQISYDDALSWLPLSGVVRTEATGHLVEGGVLTPGDGSRVCWRVRTYNTDDVAGAWSETARFLAVAAPAAPQWVGIEPGRARPLARWVAPGQAGYRLQVLRGEEPVHDTGWRSGTDNEHRVEQYLHNGAYEFRLRVRGELGLESEWASTGAQVEARTGYSIELEGVGADTGVALRFAVKAR